ncbi:hypothetical protein PAXRUDRAFT_151431, partial [Paxillus rubicundulus Ve08.2h10]
NPIAGPAHLMTSSKVAIMDFICNNLGIPVPKVLAWSLTTSTNNIGAKFILMETAPGVQLSNVWDTMDLQQKKNTINSLTTME